MRERRVNCRIQSRGLPPKWFARGEAAHPRSLEEKAWHQDGLSRPVLRKRADCAAERRSAESGGAFSRCIEQEVCKRPLVRALAETVDICRSEPASESLTRPELRSTAWAGPRKDTLLLRIDAAKSAKESGGRGSLLERCVDVSNQESLPCSAPLQSRGSINVCGAYASPLRNKDES